MSKEIILKEIDSKSVGAPTRSVIGQDNNNRLYIIKNIKSLIIMKDVYKIAEAVKQIKNKLTAVFHWRQQLLFAVKQQCF